LERFCSDSILHQIQEASRHIAIEFARLSLNPSRSSTSGGNASRRKIGWNFGAGPDASPNHTKRESMAPGLWNWHTDNREFRLALQTDEKQLDAVLSRMRHALALQAHG